MAKIKFEDKMKKLEKLINDLENGEIDLEKSIETYTEAMKLIKECDDELTNMEQHVSKIIMENGAMEDFEIKE